MPNYSPEYRRQVHRDKANRYLAEMRARGLEIPDELLKELRGTGKSESWNAFKPNGYFVRGDGKLFDPVAEQAEFIASNALFSLLYSSRGGGKSASGAQKAIARIEKGLSGAVLNPDFENFKISTWPELREWIPWDHVVKKHQHRRSIDWSPNQPFIHAFDNGAWMLCKGLKDPDSARGPNVNWLWEDEIGRDDTGAAWKIAIASVRVGKDPQAWATGTPNGMDHWVFDFFIEKKIPPEAFEELLSSGVERELVRAFQTSLEANKPNLSPVFLASLMATYQPGTWLYEQEVRGQFIARQGAIGGPCAEALRKQILSSLPDGTFSKVRYWDLAATEKKLVGSKEVNDPDATCGTLAAFDKEKFYIENQVVGYWAWENVVKNIILTAQIDGPTVKIVLEQEPASGGKNQVAAIINEIRKELPGWPTPDSFNPKTEVGDRVMGANYWFSEAVQGRVWLIAGAWNEPCIREVSSFPMGRHDDRVTSITGARYALAPINKWRNVPFLSV